MQRTFIQLNCVIPIAHSFLEMFHHGIEVILSSVSQTFGHSNFDAQEEWDDRTVIYSA